MSVVSLSSQQPHAATAASIPQENVDGFLDRLSSYIQDFRMLDKNSSGSLDVNQVKDYFRSKGLPEDCFLELLSRQKMDRFNAEQFAAAVEFTQMNRKTTSNDTNNTSDFNEVLRHCEQATKQLQGNNKVKTAHAGLLNNILKELQNIIKLFFPLAYQNYTGDEISRGIMPCTFHSDNVPEATDGLDPRGMQGAPKMKYTPPMNDSFSDSKDPHMTTTDNVTPSLQSKGGRPSMKDETTPFDDNIDKVRNQDSSYRSEVLKSLHNAGQPKNDIDCLDDQKKRDMETLAEESPTIAFSPSSHYASAAAIDGGLGTAAALNHKCVDQVDNNTVNANAESVVDKNRTPDAIHTANDSTDDNMKPLKSKKSVFPKIFGKPKDSKEDDIKDTTKSPSMRESSLKRSPENKKTNAFDPMTATPLVSVDDTLNPIGIAVGKHENDRSIPVAPPRKTTTNADRNLELANDDNQKHNWRKVRASNSAPVAPPRKIPPTKNNNAAMPDDKIYSPKLSDLSGTANNKAKDRRPLDDDESFRKTTNNTFKSSNVPAAINTAIENLKDDLNCSPDQSARAMNDNEPPTTARDMRSDPYNAKLPESNDSAPGMMTVPPGTGNTYASSTSQNAPNKGLDIVDMNQSNRIMNDSVPNFAADNNNLPDAKSKLAMLDASMKNDPFMASAHHNVSSDKNKHDVENPATTKINAQNSDIEKDTARPGIVGMISAGVLSMFSSSSKDNNVDATRNIDNEPMAEDSAQDTNDISNAVNDTNGNFTTIDNDIEHKDAEPRSKLAKIDASSRSSMLSSPAAKDKNHRSSSNRDIKDRGNDAASRTTSPAFNDNPGNTKGFNDEPVQVEREIADKNNKTACGIDSPAADDKKTSARPGLANMISSSLFSMFSSSNNLDEPGKHKPATNGPDLTEKTPEINAEPSADNIREGEKTGDKANMDDHLSKDYNPVNKLNKLDASINNTMLPSTNAREDTVLQKNSIFNADKPSLTGELPEASTDAKTPDGSPTSLDKRTGLFGFFGSQIKGDKNDHSIDDNSSNPRDINEKTTSHIDDTNDKTNNNLLTLQDNVNRHLHEPQSEIYDVPGFKNPTVIAEEISIPNRPSDSSGGLENDIGNGQLEKPINDTSSKPNDLSIDELDVTGKLPTTPEQSKSADINTPSTTSSLGKFAAGILGVFGSTPKTEELKTLDNDTTGNRDISEKINCNSADVAGTNSLLSETHKVNSANPNSIDGDCQLCSRFNKACKTQDEYRAQAAQTPSDDNADQKQPVNAMDPTGEMSGANRGISTDAQPSERSVNNSNLSAKLPKNNLVDVDNTNDVDGATSGSSSLLGGLAAGIMGASSSSFLNDESKTPVVDNDDTPSSLVDVQNSTRDMDTLNPFTNDTAQGDLRCMKTDSATEVTDADTPIFTSSADINAYTSPYNLSAKPTTDIRDSKAITKNKGNSPNNYEDIIMPTIDNSRLDFSTDMKDMKTSIEDRLPPSGAPYETPFMDVSTDSSPRELRPSVSSKVTSPFENLKSSIKDETNSPQFDDDFANKVDKAPCIDDDNAIMIAPVTTNNNLLAETPKDNEPEGTNLGRSVNKPTLEGQLPAGTNAFESDNVNTPASTSSLSKLTASIIGVFGPSNSKDETEEPAMTDNNKASSSNRGLANQPSIMGGDDSNPSGNGDLFDEKLHNTPEQRKSDIQPLSFADNTNANAIQSAMSPLRTESRSAPDAIDKSNSLNLNNAIKLDAPSSEYTNNIEPFNERTGSVNNKLNRDLPENEADLKAKEMISPKSTDVPSRSDVDSTILNDNPAAAHKLSFNAADSNPDVHGSQFDGSNTDDVKPNHIPSAVASSFGVLTTGDMGNLYSKADTCGPDTTSNNLPHCSSRGSSNNSPAEDLIFDNTRSHNSVIGKDNVHDDEKLAKLDDRVSDMLHDTAGNSNDLRKNEPFVGQVQDNNSFKNVDLSNNGNPHTTGDAVADDTDMDNKRPKELGMLAAIKGIFSSSKDLSDQPSDNVDINPATRDVDSKPFKANNTSSMSHDEKATDTGSSNNGIFGKPEVYDSKNPFAIEENNNRYPCDYASSAEKSSHDSALPTKTDANADNTFLAAPGTDNKGSKAGASFDNNAPVTLNPDFNEKSTTETNITKTNDLAKSNPAVDNAEPVKTSGERKTAEDKSHSDMSGSSSSLTALATGIKNFFGSSSFEADAVKPSETVESSELNDTDDSRNISNQPSQFDLDFDNIRSDDSVAPSRKIDGNTFNAPAASQDSGSYASVNASSRDQDSSQHSANDDDFDSIMNNVGSGMLTASTAATMAKHADTPAKDHSASEKLPKRDESLNATIVDSRFTELDNSNDVSMSNRGTEHSTTNVSRQPRDLTVNANSPPAVPAHRDSASLKSLSYHDRSAADAIRAVYENMTSRLMSGPNSSAGVDEERVLKVRPGFGNFAGFGVKCVADGC
ncbi:hypothetical protein BDF20DRAFT_915965 [Mycotypha africana]|uniref:uncharacterized protein n=1 Tax=Mycotypha africana TaxID=64632 RepID=UPI0022FFEBCE|nr:uncharacterized protein BDF20DRAFT_915965 [Mycotypha africana]KAI8970101.1 hypothetical protein BDF20DRAFT_915965 [Mycotypha africana]